MTFWSNAVIGILGLTLGMGHLAHAQQEDVSFQANLSKETLGLNERLRVEFRMNKDGDNFSPPTFEGFRVVMGPSQSISSSWINGLRSFSKTYSYVLVPTARGTFTLGQATIEIDGATYKTLPQTVSVTAAVDNPNATPTVNDVADESLHLVAEVSKQRPYLNEAVTVVYKLYINPDIRVSDYRALDNPTYNNFWSQEIPVTEHKAQNGTYKGKPYRYVVLKRVVLYPQKSGRLEIEPLSLEVSVDVPINRRDFFGGRIYKQTHKTVSAGRRTLRVKPLPKTGQPANFSGAVGDFTFAVTTSKEELNASESFQARVEVSGQGNLKLFPLPEPDLPGALEVYEPEYEERIETLSTGMRGTVANSYTVVPAFRGKYPMPSIAFNYFNPKTGTYVTRRSKATTIEVLEGPKASTNATANSQRLVPLEQHFYFIKLTPNLSPIGTPYFWGSTAFYALLFGPLLLLPIAVFSFKKRAALASDVAGHKIKRANRLAKKYLHTAKKALGDKKAFYVAMEKGLHNYLKAKLHLETSEFSKEKITAFLRDKNVATSEINSFMALLKSCEMARYSPFSEVQMQNDYEKASTVIATLDKQL